MNAAKNAIIQVLTRILPSRLKNSMFHLSFHLARAEFEKFAYDYCFAPHMAFGLKGLAKRGFSPRTIVDIGAFEGEWSSLARQVWPTSHLIMVEPNFAKHPLLVDVARKFNASLFADLLGAEDDAVVRFNVMGPGSSVMCERSEVPRTIESRRLRTLDSILTEVEPPGFLKIDTQGYELQILQGASRVLPAFEAVLLEIAIIEINEGAPLLHQVVAFMKALGFVAYDILQIHRRGLDGALSQVDIVFVREESRLIEDKRLA